MREELDTLVNELKKLKQQGVSSLLMEPDTLDLLENEASKLIPAVNEHETKGSTSTVPSHSAEVVADAKGNVPTPQPALRTHREKTKSTGEKKDYHDIPSILLPEGSKSERWKWLENRVLGCPVCNNHTKTGKKVVFGVGSLDAEIFFCGEAPGEEEEIRGEPFVGPAGQLLTKIIQAMGLSREKVYIGNIMNWRPETDTPYGNRPPTEEEMQFCLPYLKAQLQIVKPKVIVALGATAVNGLLGYDAKRSITRSHGEWHEFETIPTIVSFHPSYILRNGTNRVKRLIWEDMLAVMSHLSMPISERQQGFFR